MCVRVCVCVCGRVRERECVEMTLYGTIIHYASHTQQEKQE